MQAACSSCGTQHVLSDAQIAGHTRVQFRCSKCGQATIVEIARRPDRTMVITPLPSFARSEGRGSGGAVPGQYDGLELPAGMKITLTVVSGPSKGLAYTLEKPRVVLGRVEADFALNDPEVSRWHCSLEVKDTIIRLKDLDSTNGTFFEDERVRAAELRDGAEFRIGNSLIRLSVEPK